jgi:hypothetical protein
MEGTSGYWVEDDSSGEVGFLREFEDTFWVYDENSYAWIARRFLGRRVRKGQPKGKEKGKGAKGKSRFIPYKQRQKGGKKGQAHAADSAWTGKGKGKKGKNKGGWSKTLARVKPMP